MEDKRIKILSMIAEDMANRNMMDLQDFACAISELMWGGELGWDRPNGLDELYKAVKRKVKLIEKIKNEIEAS